MMDKGEFIKIGYKVERGEGDSWVVSRYDERMQLRGLVGFTCSEDLIKWLTEEHRVLRTGGAERTNPGDYSAAQRPTSPEQDQ